MFRDTAIPETTHNNFPQSAHFHMQSQPQQYLQQHNQFEYSTYSQSSPMLDSRVQSHSDLFQGFAFDSSSDEDHMSYFTHQHMHPLINIDNQDPLQHEFVMAQQNFAWNPIENDDECSLFHFESNQQYQLNNEQVNLNRRRNPINVDFFDQDYVEMPRYPMNATVHEQQLLKEIERTQQEVLSRGLAAQQALTEAAVNKSSKCASKKEVESSRKERSEVESIPSIFTACQPIESAFEQILQETQNVVPVRNYYQLFHSGVVSIPESASSECSQVQSIEVYISEQQVASTNTESIPSGFSEQVTDERRSYEQKELEQFEQDNEIEEQGEVECEQRLQSTAHPLEECRKKNVVKNIMNALKKFILNPIEHGYSQQVVSEVVALYNRHAKAAGKLSNASSRDDSCEDGGLENMQAKFKRYLAHKKFNHYSLGLLMHHPVYVHVLQYFLNGPVEHWAMHSRVNDLHSHWTIIRFLRSCFDDLSLLALLEKKKNNSHQSSSSIHSH